MPNFRSENNFRFFRFEGLIPRGRDAHSEDLAGKRLASEGQHQVPQCQPQISSGPGSGPKLMQKFLIELESLHCSIEPSARFIIFEIFLLKS
jgi:hypothetical protein